MAATPKPKPKSAEEQAQESLKRLAMYAGGAMLVLSLFASCLGKRQRVADASDIPVSVPTAEAPPATPAGTSESTEADTLPIPVPAVVDAPATPADEASKRSAAVSREVAAPSPGVLLDGGTWSGPGGPPPGAPVPDAP